MDTYLRQKADDNNKPLNVNRVNPCSFVKIENSKVVKLGEFKSFTLNPGESVILQFPEHHVGYINYKAISKGNIADSPTVIKFIAAEYIAELTTPHDEYDGVLSSGWLQREERASLFLPASERLNRRFAFNLLKVERLDTGIFPIEITELYCDAVSASSMENLKKLNCDNQRLQDIYRFSAKTLLDCSQDVIEDAPKRDCRLWTGEFRISALVDTETFRNRNLVKRCLYLFGAHKIDDRIVAPCVFQCSPPYIDDDWYFIDFVLWFVAALNDYDEAYGEQEILDDLYPTAREQLKIAKDWYDNVYRHPRASFWIDWKTELDRSTSRVGLYLYVLRKAKRLAQKKNDNETVAFVDNEIERQTKILLAYFDKDKNLFSSDSGQISVVSQVYGILSGVFDKEKCSSILDTIIAYGDNAVQLHTPNIHYYYLEAMYKAGRKDLMMDLIENVWGRLIDEGELCSPEYLPWIKCITKYKHPVMDSACHGSGAAPAYWLQILAKENGGKL